MLHPPVNHQSSNIHICEAKEVSPPISPYIDFRCKLQPQDFSLQTYHLTNERNQSSFQTSESLQPHADTSQNTPNTYRTAASVSRAVQPSGPNAEGAKEADSSASQSIALKQKIAELRELNEMKDMQALAVHKENKRLLESEELLKQQLKETQSRLSDICRELQEKDRKIESLQFEVDSLTKEKQENMNLAAISSQNINMPSEQLKPNGCEEQNCKPLSLSLLLQRPAGAPIDHKPRAVYKLRCQHEAS